MPRNAFYHRSDIDAGSRGLVAAHSYAYEWYTSNTIIGQAHDGFWYSPWLANAFPAGSAPAGPVFHPASDPLQTKAVTNFQSFGTVLLSNDAYTVSEELNAGIFAGMEMPIGAESLRFQYRFAVAGDGDFLSVHWGTNEVLYLGVDLPISRDGFIDGEVAIADFAGETNQLVFKLVSRGATNAVLVLSNIVLTISDDPDGDGLRTDIEQGLGTNPLAYDTDGDSLNDADELTVYMTNPLSRDSDNDGLSDADELAADTNPNNPASTFRVASIRFDSPSAVTLQWAGSTNRFYRVNRSITLSRDNYTTLTNGVRGVLPFNTFTHPLATNRTSFYWVETE